MVADNSTTSSSTGTRDGDGALLDRFQQQGTSVSASGNQPLLLSDTTTAWLVAGAPLQIFAVRLRDGVVDGARLPVMRVRPGSLLFGHEPLEIGGQWWSLMAVGLPDTRVVALSLAELGEGAAGVGLRRQSERWLQALVRSIRPGLGPKSSTGLVSGVGLSLADGETGMVFDAPVWLRVTSGRATLFGGQDAGIDAGSGLLPLALGTWLEADGPLEAEVVGSAADADVAQALVILPELVVQRGVARAATRLQQDRERLQQDELSDARTTDRALRHILGIYSQDEDVVALDPADGDDPLLAACKLVGQVAGIEVATPPRQDGPTIDPLRTIARGSRFRTRRVLLDGSWWTTDSGPLLGYLRENDTPVALLPHARGGYVVVDGETGEQTRVDASVSALLQPWSDMFYRPFPQVAMDAMSLLRFGFRDTGRDLWAIVVLGILGGTLGLATPIATGWLINDIIPEHERSQVLQLSLALMASAIAVAAFTITRNVALLRIEGRADIAVQSAVWDRLLSLPVPFFGNYTAGDLGTRALGIDRIRQSLSDVTTTALLAFIFSLPSFVLQVFISPSLAMISLLLLVGMLLVTWLATRRQVVIQRELLAVGGYLQGLVLQLLNGIPKLRIAGAERRAFSVWARSYSHQSDLARRNQIVQMQLSVVFAVFPALATLVLFGIYVTYQWNTISTGAFLSFNAAFGQIVGAAIGMATAIGAMTSIVPTFERAKPILDALPESDDSKADPGVLRGEIEVSGVDFAYNEGDPLTLQDVSFRVRAGEFVALVGPSGAGKSTLLRLLIGFDRPTSGSVLFDGQNLDAVDVQSVRRQMGVVLQNGTVMPGELGQNIIGTTQLTLDDAWTAARLSGLEADIKAMPMGMHTYVMEGGTTLSGGQRQRLMIARAIVNRPRILIFDEATSALDNRTQEIVRESLEQLNSTRIVIAHRLSTIMRADRIHVLVAGRIVQSGTYEELMAVDGPFMQMAKRQLV